MSDKNYNLYDLIVIGSGPAGLTASIYTGRAKLKTLVLGKKENSRLFKAHLVANYFGFPEGIGGKELLERGIKQAKNSGVTIKEEEAVNIKQEEDKFIVKTRDNRYQSKSILLVTGVKNRTSGLFGEEKLTGRGISFCVSCDGSYFQNKKIGVLGSGDFAAEETQELLKYTKDITIYSDGNDFSIKDDLKKELEDKRIKFDGSKMKEFLGEEKLEGILKENGEKINLDGVFVAKDTPQASDFANKLGVEILNDYIVCDNKGKTNIKGVFTAGDVTGVGLQVGSAVGSAVNVSFSIIVYLNERK